MNAVWALVPLKSFALAKSRLAAVLNAAERAALAEAMARDVFGALKQCAELAGVAVLAGDQTARRLADDFGFRVVNEIPDRELSANLEAAARQLAAGQDAAAVLILPTDLPTLQSTHIASLLAFLRPGITVVPAHDGGSNVLIMAPPDAGKCLFGPDSARRHLESAARCGVAARQLELGVFARDIDTVDDLRWLCRQSEGAHTQAWLTASGIRARLAGMSPGIGPK